MKSIILKTKIIKSLFYIDELIHRRFHENLYLDVWKWNIAGYEKHYA